MYQSPVGILTAIEKAKKVPKNTMNMKIKKIDQKSNLKSKATFVAAVAATLHPTKCVSYLIYSQQHKYSTTD